jgi:hypothetical protein
MRLCLVIQLCLLDIVSATGLFAMSIPDFVNEYSGPGYFDLNAFSQTHSSFTSSTLNVDLSGITEERCYLLDSRNYSEVSSYYSPGFSYNSFWGSSSSNFGIRLNNGTNSSYTTLFAGYPTPQTAPSSTIGSLPYVDCALDPSITSFDFQTTFTWDCSCYYSVDGFSWNYDDLWSTTVDTAVNNTSWGGSYFNFYSVPELGNQFILGSIVSDPYYVTYGYGPYYSDVVFLLEGNPGGGAAVPEPHTYLLIGMLLSALFARAFCNAKKEVPIEPPKA